MDVSLGSARLVEGKIVKSKESWMKLSLYEAHFLVSLVREGGKAFYNVPNLPRIDFGAKVIGSLQVALDTLE